jgi:hypothetical protein
MTCIEIIKKYLKDNNFDGLCNVDCGCDMENLIACGEYFSDCIPGYKRLPTEEDNEYGEADYIIDPTKVEEQKERHANKKEMGVTMNKLRQILEEGMHRTHGTSYDSKLDDTDEMIIDDVVDEIKKAFLEMIGKDKQEERAMHVENIMYVRGYNQAKAEIRQKVEE